MVGKYICTINLVKKRHIERKNARGSSTRGRYYKRRRSWKRSLYNVDL